MILEEEKNFKTLRILFLIFFQIQICIILFIAERDMITMNVIFIHPAIYQSFHCESSPLCGGLRFSILQSDLKFTIQKCTHYIHTMAMANLSIFIKTKSKQMTNE